VKSAYEIINDSVKAVKATLFGKFYEKIILCWLRERKGFVPFNGKPRVYWKDIKLTEGDSQSTCKLKQILESLKNNNRQYCTPDGFLKK